MIHKKLISSTVFLTMLGFIGGSAVNVAAQEVSSQEILSVMDITDPEAPPVDGGEDGDGVVNHEDPSNPWEISISEVTDWNFGTLENYDPSLGASMVAVRAENNTFNHIVVDDKREDAGAAGFTTLSLGEGELRIPKHQNIAEGEKYTSVITWDLTAERA